jgi:hypothetical protein
MIDLTQRTIKRLFEKQIRELTKRTILQHNIQHDRVFDYQLSGGWI